MLTDVTEAPVDVKHIPSRSEPVPASGRRGCAGRCCGEIRPCSSGGVVDVQVLEGTCATEGGKEKTTDLSSPWPLAKDYFDSGVCSAPHALTYSVTKDHR